ncbi:MAG: hypothetical protein ABJB04_05940 [Betaproteobacteria bacterium]
MADHDDDPQRLQRPRRVDHVRKHRTPAHRVQNFRQIGAHPRAQTRSHDDDLERHDVDFKGKGGGSDFILEPGRNLPVKGRKKYLIARCRIGTYAARAGPVGVIEHCGRIQIRRATGGILSRFVSPAFRTALGGVLFLAASFASTFAEAAAGQLDPTFGNGGTQIVPDNLSTYAYPVGMAVQADNKILVTGYSAGSFLLRLTAGGSPDTSFGVGGTGRLSTVSNPGTVLVQPDGRILAVGGSSEFEVARYKPDGTPDTSFGGNGRVQTAFTTTPTGGAAANSAVIQPDGKIVVVGYAGLDYSAHPYSSNIALVRLNPDGTLDPGFGMGGKVLTGYPSGYAIGTAIALQADGKLVVAGYNFSDTTDTKEHWVIARYKTDGALDATFSGGIVTTSLGANVEFSRHVVVQPDGKIVVGGSGGNAGAVVRYNANGTLDGGFGNGGILSPVRSGTYDAYGLALQPDGKIIVGLTLQNSSMGALRLFANGTPDPSYTPPATLTFGAGTSNYSAVLQPDGKLMLAGSFKNAGGKQDLGFARLQGDEITGTVVEFYNTILKHYFVTASLAEQTSIDAGGSGPGWMRTGLNFKSGGNSRVCRFYGTPGVGPNSHFYTVSAEECGLVKLDPGWHFESYDFSGSPPTGPGVCPAGTVPVYRAYNNRFAFNDSNHRQTTNLAAYNATVATGWIGEGVVMCTPV